MQARLGNAHDRVWRVQKCRQVMWVQVWGSLVLLECLFTLSLVSNGRERGLLALDAVVLIFKVVAGARSSLVGAGVSRVTWVQWGCSQWVWVVCKRLAKAW